ncbi:MAG: ATP-binding protein, partial [Planctomycetota bacterium]
SSFPVECNPSPLPTGRVLSGVILEVRDVSAHKSLEAQLHQSQKMEAFGQLAGGVAHDFNNLLTIIMGYSEMILSQMTKDDPKREMVADIHHAGDRAATLTRQLLAFSRKQVLEPKIVELNGAVGSVEKMLRRLIGEDIVVTCVLRPVAKVKVDPGQLEQVILNLAVNARDAMPRGGRLTIETAEIQWAEDDPSRVPECPAGKYVLLSIADTGSGMTPEIRTRIFEPFFTTKGVGKGTGLGLATVFGIVKQSEGHILVDSELGQGTTFKIYFPAAEQANEGAETESKGQARGGHERVLIVEDEAPVRQLAKISLERFGYRVLEAASGAAAIAAFEAIGGEIDLLMSDVVMPAMSGRELAEILCQRKPGLRVLFVSGYNDDAIVRHGVVQSERAFLQKPYSYLDLAKKVRELLDGAT